MRFYLLDDFGQPQLESDPLVWAAWFEKAQRQIAFARAGGTEISCVFLGIDHGPGGDAPPEIYEVMVFNPRGFASSARFATRTEAIAAFDEFLSDAEGE